VNSIVGCDWVGWAGGCGCVGGHDTVGAGWSAGGGLAAGGFAGAASASDHEYWGQEWSAGAGVVGGGAGDSGVAAVGSSPAAFQFWSDSLIGSCLDFVQCAPGMALVAPILATAIGSRL
jgi:hypothetical protein